MIFGSNVLRVKQPNHSTHRGLQPWNLHIPAVESKLSKGWNEGVPKEESKPTSHVPRFESYWTEMNSLRTVWD